MDSQQFVEGLRQYVTTRLAALDLLEDHEVDHLDGAGVVQRLKMALKNELEAAELAAAWIPTTPEVDVKLALARQAGDEARHYALIEKHLDGMGASLEGFDPAAGGYGPMFQLLAGMESTIERVAAAHFTREALALKKNEQFIEFCERTGHPETARLYREKIQPDEGWHVDLGDRTLRKYVRSAEDQQRVRDAVDKVLDLAVKIQNKQLHEMKVSHAPGC